ncbi:IS3 family transposase [Burkholderia diffusa]|uniref:IS3 family transposase n=1 Tax=Burkholderia diffusa TaxID=488732 RepID=UPI0012DB07CC|nr:IS3 family transposase [Burkholderia diffusa]
MTKYDERFRRRVVQAYLAGEAGTKTLAHRYGVGRTMVRRWVASYREHGEDGLSKKHSHYDARFKLSVLQRMRRDELSYAQVAALFGIRNERSIPIWERLYHEGGIDALAPRRRGRPPKMTTSPPPKSLDDTVQKEPSREELLKEIVYLRAEVAYPKKARCAAAIKEADSAQEKTQIIRELRQCHPVAALLKAAGLARSTFYYQLKVLDAGDRYADLKVKIRSVYDHHKGRYGYRRITTVIRQAGHAINHKTVQRLMGQLQLKSLVRPKRYRSWRGEVGRVAPNLLRRQFDAERPNQKWVTDVTEFNVGGPKLYLSPVMDLYNGEIVAYQMDERPSFELVSGMLKKAVAKLDDEGRPLLHSDQGWQYQMPAYRRLLKQHALTQSMSRRGNCLDNAAMESFFGTLKSECYRLARFANVEQLRDALSRYIHYYNHERIKLKLNGLSPVQYRTQPLAA